MSLAIDFIKEAEGLRLESYQDGAGVWTIGYGHTGQDVKRGQKIGEDRAEELLAKDMAWALDLVEKTVKAPLTEGQHAAVTSLIFNIGPGAWRSSTCLRRLNAKNYEGAADALTWWNKITVDGKKVVSKGLVNRRERERVMFMSMDDTGVDESPPPASRGSVGGGEAKPMPKSKTLGASLGGLGGLATAVVPGFAQMDWKVALPLVVVGGFLAYLAFNRWLESRRGVH